MKNLISIFGFASLLMLSFAFTPADKIINEAALFNGGEFGGCVTSFVPAGADVNVDIVETTSNTVVSSNDALACDASNAFLPAGTYSVVVTTNVNATVDYKWNFCNGAETGQGTIDIGAGDVETVGTFTIN